MTTPTAQIVLKPRDRDSGLLNFVQDTITLYDGGPVSIATIDHATSGARGYHTTFKRSKGHRSAGRFSVASLPVQYNTDGTAKIDNRLGVSTTIKSSALIKGFQQYEATVTGATALTDVGEYFWILEDGSLTLTIPDIDTGFSSIPDGEILRWITSTTCEVLEYSFETKAAIAAAGGIFYYLSFHLDWTGVADGKLRDNFKMNHHGKIVEAFAINDVALTGSGGTLVVNASLSTVDISTAGITLSTAATPAQAAKTSLTLLATAARETFFHQGDNLDIDISAAGGTRTTGKCTIYFRIMRKLGL